jgi:putative hemolysin
VIIVSNHPFGGIDGIILASILNKVRKDFKILANYFLEAIPDLRPTLFLVDPFGGKDSTKTNIGTLKTAVRWVKDGGMLAAFPAGEVSHFSWKKRKIEDPDWNLTIARLSHMAKAPVLPIFFHGYNSSLFHAAGLIHPILRTLMLPRELLKKRDLEIRLKIGHPIPYKRLSLLNDPADLTAYLRFRTYLLKKAFTRSNGFLKLPLRKNRNSDKFEPIALPQEKSDLAKEVASLPDGHHLLKSGTLSVYFARAHQMPCLLPEIGRLREETFRLAGEGTGKSIDLDRFDQDYIHLFIWNEETHEIVGAYRLGPTDEILPKKGRQGLYTHTLFKYKWTLLHGMGPALEMGRTFIRPEYQKSYSPLLLLWRGIGQFVAQNPKYKTLFGPVSITNDYRTYSRQLMAAFLKANNFLPDLSRMVKPRKKFKQKSMKSLGKNYSTYWQDDIEELSSWVSGIEGDGKGVPILLKQYLKLGGKILSFNLDPDFGNALDGLIMVDLLQTETRIMKRYMGEEGYKDFMHYHRSRSSAEKDGLDHHYDTVANA